MTSFSDDMGETWSHSEEAVPGDRTTRIAVRNKLLIASDGSWLGPCSTEGEKYWDSMIDISRDSGKTWNKHPIPFDHDGAPPQTGGGEWSGIGDVMLRNTAREAVLGWDGIIQPTLWESEPGVFHAFMRSTRGRIYRSDSEDNGDTWREAYPTALPNNNSGIDLARLDDGTLALAHNPVSGNWTLRTPLSVSLSFDNGETFPERIDVETGDGEFSYPAIIPEGDTLHMTYTFKRKSIVYCAIDIQPSGRRPHCC